MVSRLAMLVGRGLVVGVAVIAVIVGLALRMWPVMCCRTISPDPTYVPNSDPDRCRVGDDRGRDLRTKGFTVVRNFLTEGEVKAMLNIHSHMLPSAYHPGYRMPLADHKVWYPRSADEILRELLPGLENRSGIRVSGDGGSLDSSYIEEEFLTASAFDPRMVNYNWHSDFEAYFLSQATTQYFNIYIFLDKPVRDDAGVSFVPWDELRAVSREVHDKAVATGAVSCSPYNTNLSGLGLHGDPSTDEFYALNFSLDSIACTPDMGPGDLVVFRGDTMHRTQTPRNSSRVSWSVRIAADDFSVMRALSGGMKKYERLRFIEGSIARRAVIAKFGRKSHRGLFDSIRVMALARFIQTYIRAGFWYRAYLLEVRRWAGRLLYGEVWFTHSGAFHGFQR